MSTTECVFHIENGREKYCLHHLSRRSLNDEEICIKAYYFLPYVRNQECQQGDENNCITHNDVFSDNTTPHCLSSNPVSICPMCLETNDRIGDDEICIDCNTQPASKQICSYRSCDNGSVGVYCFMHKKKCPECTNRIFVKYKYCEECRTGECIECGSSEGIRNTKGKIYCEDHKYRCKTPSCRGRNSKRNKKCDMHKRSS